MDAMDELRGEQAVNLIGFLWRVLGGWDFGGGRVLFVL